MCEIILFLASCNDLTRNYLQILIAKIIPGILSFFFFCERFQVVRLAKVWGLDILNTAAKNQHWTPAALFLC